jgi:hypothetical protein
LPARWQRLIGEVTIEQADGLVRICHAGGEVARHLVLRGRRERAIDPAYLAGIVVATRDRSRHRCRPTGAMATAGGSDKAALWKGCARRYPGVTPATREPSPPRLDAPAGVKGAETSGATLTGWYNGETARANAGRCQYV